MITLFAGNFLNGQGEFVFFNAKFKTIRNKIIMALTAFVILEHNPNNLQRPLALSLSTLSHCISFEGSSTFIKIFQPTGGLLLKHMWVLLN